LTRDFEEELLGMEGIERVSTVIASPFHLTQIYSEEGQEFSAEIGDYAGLATQEITLIGIDDQYPSTIKTQYVEFTQGDIVSSFEQLFSSPDGYPCIISEGLSVSLDMHLGDVIRISIQRGYENEVYTFKIVGVAAAMPGFSSEFGRSSASANMGGVMISQEIYMTLMDIPPISYLEKIFVKLNLHSQGLSQRIIDLIKENEDEFDFEVISLQQRVTQQQLLFSIIDIFFSITLDATVIICLFGLLSSSYSTIIERKKEIGIIRTLGLKGKEIVRMFTIEALIIMMSSGTVGVIVGWVTGLLLSMSMNMMSGLPNIPVFPLSDMIVVFSLSIIFTLIGIKLLLRKSRKKKIVDIYRETM